MVGGDEDQAHHVGDGKTDKGHGTTESGGDGGEQARDKKEPVAGALDVDTEVLGIAIAQKKGVEGLDEQQGASKAQQGDDNKDGHQGHRHIAKAAHAPHHIGLDTLVGGKEIEQGDGGIGDIANHNADDKQHDMTAHEGREKEDETHDGHGAEKGGGKNGNKACHADAANRQATSEHEHDEGHAQTCTTADAKDARACQGIAEGGLQQQATDSQGSTTEHGGDGLGQTGLEDNETPAGLYCLIAQNDAKDIGSGDVDGAHHEVHHKEDGTQQEQDIEG